MYHTPVARARIARTRRGRHRGRAGCAPSPSTKPTASAMGEGMSEPIALPGMSPASGDRGHAGENVPMTMPAARPDPFHSRAG